MNKIILLFVMLIMIVVRAYPQAVESGNFEAGAGTGFGLFQLNHNDSSGSNNPALSGILQGHFQYAPINNLSVGILFQRNGFVTDRDSGRSVQTYLFGGGIHYRAINSENTVIYFGLSGGPSWMHFYDKGQDNYVNGEGYWLDLVAGTRYYITNKAGIFVEISYNKQHLTHFDDKNNNLLMVGPVNNRQEFVLNMTGMNLRIGLNFKFGKK